MIADLSMHVAPAFASRSVELMGRYFILSGPGAFDGQATELRDVLQSQDLVGCCRP
jgi:hypothetical protein